MAQRSRLGSRSLFSWMVAIAAISGCRSYPPTLNQVASTHMVGTATVKADVSALFARAEGRKVLGQGFGESTISTVRLTTVGTYKLEDPTLHFTHARADLHAALVDFHAFDPGLTQRRVYVFGGLTTSGQPYSMTDVAEVADDGPLLPFYPHYTNQVIERGGYALGTSTDGKGFFLLGGRNSGSTGPITSVEAAFFR